MTNIIPFHPPVHPIVKKFFRDLGGESLSDIAADEAILARFHRHPAIRENNLRPDSTPIVTLPTKGDLA